MPRQKKAAQENYIYTYYQGIKDGSICVGKWIEMLYEYLVHSIEDKSLIYDGKKANAAIDWIETHCYHVEGILAPNNIKLELWQKAFLSAIYGLLDPKTGMRQFREIVLVVARKNGKSLIGSSLGRMEWLCGGGSCGDRGYGNKVFCIAPKLDQADIIYNTIWQMTTLDPEWQALKEAVRGTKDGRGCKTMDDAELARHRQTDLLLPATNSTVKKIPFSSKRNDGWNPSLTIADEVSSWVGDTGLKAYEVMKSAMGARPEGMIISCTTSGYVRDSIYDELIKRSTRFLMGESKERRLLPFLYMIDDTNKWNDINELRKSNPNLGVSVSVDYLLEEIAVAEQSLSKKSEFLCKYCNLPAASSLAWLSAQTVNKAYTGKHLDLNDFKSSYAVLGIDLSRTTDLTSAVLLIERDGIVNVFAKFWLPAQLIDEATARDGVPYRAYIQRGLLEPSGENFIDYNDCYNWVRSIIEEYEIYPLWTGYDRYNAQYLTEQLKSIGCHMDDVVQGFNLSPIIEEMEGMLKDGTFNIGDNDLLKMHLLSSAMKHDTDSGKRKLVKMSVNEHIDGTAAWLDAMTVRHKYYAEIGEQLKNTRGD